MPVVTNSLRQGKLKYDPNGVYFVLTSPDIDVPGFCTRYCGYHVPALYNGQALLYSFVGHSGRCIKSCAHQR